MFIMKKWRSDTALRRLLQESPGTGEVTPPGAGAIVVNVDGSDASLRAWAYAAGVARSRGRRLVCVHVRRTVPVPFVPDPWDSLGIYGIEWMSAHLEANEAACLQILQDATAWGASFTYVRRIGGPVAELRKVLAEEGSVDMLVVGAGTSIVRKIGLAAACGMGRRWPCPVVIVP